MSSTTTGYLSQRRAEIFVSRRWIRRGKFCVLIELCTRFTFVGCIEPIWASAVRSTAAGNGEGAALRARGKGKEKEWLRKDERIARRSAGPSPKAKRKPISTPIFAKHYATAKRHILAEWALLFVIVRGGAAVVLILDGTSFAELRRRRDSRISRWRRMEFVCRNLHLNRVDARAHTIRSIDCGRSVRICSFGATSLEKERCAKVLKYLKYLKSPSFNLQRMHFVELLIPRDIYPLIKREKFLKLQDLCI